MNALQECLLEVLLEFKRVCDENNLEYFLDCGTLLGAVRHQGFIPWDDDVDVCMPRKDYERLIELDKQGVFKEKFAFKHWDKTKNYIWGYGRLEDQRTTTISSAFDWLKNSPLITNNRIAYKSGAGIDVFILDGGGADKSLAKKHFSFLVRLDAYICFRYRKLSPQHKKFPKKIILRFLALLSKNNLWINFLKWLYKYKIAKFPFDDKNSELLGNIVQMEYPSMQCLYPKSVIYPLSEVSFEGHTFKAPADTDMYLREMYGDYMQLPPEEERTGHLPAYVNLDLPYEKFDYSMIEKA
ncbi:LicD family protein [Helicobacter sp. 11S02596-1]|uniref:LicD family protein n=1 Tax=Helicobacter sp. 11S02596-1 TaxID=1476194 RepID=UPI000BA5137C|nr:LicD family protein [Helicobacter sp. 11S02596-1]PAF41511.1 hypothetical protein BJI48_08300 [Helicobacter sp. 11S02596-1]